MSARRRRLAVAWTLAAVIIASAPFAQQLFTALGERSPAWLSILEVAATVGPALLVSLIALRRIRDRHLFRYSLAAAGFAVGAAYIDRTDLSFAESFHFAEYGVLAMLFYRAWKDAGDWTAMALPLLAGALVGSLDEWVQWFIPIRVGEMRDVVINVLATGCGLLIAIAIDTPRGIRFALDPRSRMLIVRWTAATAIVWAWFFYSVHMGYDIRDPEIGSFRSNATAAELARAARDRAARWRQEPPILGRRLWREDHYLTEGLWHVAQRDLAWERGDIAMAWRENRILEKFFAPVLDIEGPRWPAEQRVDAAARAASAMRPIATRDYAVPLYVWPHLF